jgi:hypothetical protein
MHLISDGFQRVGIGSHTGPMKNKFGLMERILCEIQVLFYQIDWHVQLNGRMRLIELVRK